MEELDWTAIRAFSSTGECSNPTDMRYLSRLAGTKPVIEYCGGTELGGGYISSTVIEPNIPSAFSTPTLGTNFVVFDEDGSPSSSGEVYLIHPALGMSRQLLNGNHFETYYQGVPAGPHGEVLRRHGDRLQRLPNGYFRALGRVDDAINLGGIKIGCAEIERVLAETGASTEVAVIGVPQGDGGPTRLVACVGSGGQVQPDAKQLRPRTATNKIMRRELRKIYDRERSNPAGP
jgi:acetyl-CoA synthetase